MESFFSLICILKAKLKAKEITRNVIPTIGDITDFIVRGPIEEVVKAGPL